MDPVLTEHIDTLKSNRWDIFAFVGAFVIGVTVYFILRITSRMAGIEPGLSQAIITASIVGVMVLYALTVARIPRLRVRLDQAGDNAYYLGLLFTLVSMAVALWEFGTVISGGGANPPHESGARQIVSNFGIALASTITGIFLRVVLHHMRVDPADVESMTRIELSDASKRVKASLDGVTIDLGRFHDEVRQRTDDVLKQASEETGKSCTIVTKNMEEALQEMLKSTQSVQESVIKGALELTKLLGGMAVEVKDAVERLKSIEPPPLTLSRRLERLTKLLESLEDQAKGITSQLEGTAGAAGRAAEKLEESAAVLLSVNEGIAKTQGEAARTLSTAVERVSTSLEDVGKRLQDEQALLAKSIGDNVKGITSQLEGTAGAAGRAAEKLEESAAVLLSVNEGIAKTQGEAARTLSTAVERVSTSLEDVGKRLQDEQALLAKLEEQSGRSADEAVRAQIAAVEVLTCMTEVTRRLTTALKADIEERVNAEPA